MKRLAALLAATLALMAQQPSSPNFILIPEPAAALTAFVLARDGSLSSGRDLLVDAKGRALATPGELHTALQALSDAMNASYAKTTMNADIQWRGEKTK